MKSPLLLCLVAAMLSWALPASATPFDFTLKLGVRITETGEYVTKINNNEIDQDVDVTSGPLFVAGDVLLPIEMGSGAILRLGAGLMLVPTFEYQPSDGTNTATDFDIGTELDLTAVAELLFPLWQGRMSIFGRAFVGVGLLAPHGDLSDRLEGANEDCSADNRESRCSVGTGPFLSPVYGASGGITMRLTKKFTGRLEFLWQHYSFDIFSLEGEAATQSETLSGDRFLLLAGIEL